MKRIIHSITFRYAVPIHLSAIIGIILWLIFLLCSANAQAQWSITAANTNVTQNFNAMGSGATLPAGFQIISPRSAAPGFVDYAADAGSLAQNQTGGAYNFGSGTDRSIGILNSGTYTSGKYVVLHIINNTGSLVNAVTIHWKYEKYRTGSRAWNWNFYHGPTSVPGITEGNGNQSYAADGDNATNSNPPISVSKNVTITGLNIPAGNSYYFRWVLTGSGGSTNGQALAIDDVTISLTSACSPGTPAVALGTDVSYCDGEIFSMVLNAQNTGAGYEWNNGATTQTLTANTAGTYSVKVTDNNGCIGRDTIVVTEKPVPIIHLGNDTAYCAGTPFSLQLDAQNMGATYDWNNGASATQNFTANAAGTYKVEVTHPNGCSAADSLTVTENALPIVNLGNDTAFCTGTVFSWTLDAENTGSTYQWNDGTIFTQTYIATQAGTYSVSVTDANGCIGSDELTVSEHLLPNVDLGNDTAYCAGSPFALELDAENTGSTYQWNSGTQTQTYMATQAGIYSVSVTDVNGCIGSDELTVTEHILPAVDLGHDTAYCAGSPFLLLLDATSAGSTYSWNGGIFSAPIFVVTQAGPYWVTVTNMHGCSVSDSVSVSEHALPIVNLGNDTSYCTGSTFSLLLNVQNIGSTYVWGNGSITPTVTATQAGLYSVTVTDAHGCTNRDSLLVSEAALPNIDLGNDVWVSGNSHVLNAGGGFVNYLWLPGNHTSQQITVNQSGNYIVSVTNAEGCKASDTISVTIGAASIDEAYTDYAVHIFPNPSTGIFQLNLTESGTFRMDVISHAGQLVFSKSVTPTAETSSQIDLSHLPNGTYHLRLSGAKYVNSQKIIINH